MTGTGIVAISRHGSDLARSLTASLGGDATLYLERRFHREGEGAVPFDLPVRPLLHRLYKDHQRLVLFMPVGAAVRLLAPYLHDKHVDPAVVCVDGAGRFAVSLLSGHLGGADRLAQQVAEALGATPVVTSASHVTGTLAVDLLGHELGWRIEAAPAALTRASAAVVNGDPVGVYQEAGEPEWWPPDRPLPGNIVRYPSLDALLEAPCAAVLLITDRLTPMGSGPKGRLADGKDRAVVVYRPRTLAAGMGCRRGVSVAELDDLLIGAFERHGLALSSLRCIATAELKRDEPGIGELADKYGVPVQCYTSEELNSVFGPQTSLGNEVAGGDPPNPSLQKGEFPKRKGKGERPDAGDVAPGPTPSAAAHRLLGVWGVSEPAALLAAGSKELLVTRVKTTRATIAIARVAFRGGAY